MKTPLKLSLVAMVVAAFVMFFKAPLMQGIYSFVTMDMFVNADEDNFDPGPKVGTEMPAISGIFDGKEVDSIKSFAGLEGTIFIASRSFEWCPYCMRQLIQLQQNKSLFEQAGIGLVVMTYDEPEQQRMFAQKHDIDIPMLSDIDAKTFENLNILNAEYNKTDEHYGLPYPGMIILDREGVIVGKLFVEAYSRRVNAEASLRYALSKLKQ